MYGRLEVPFKWTSERNAITIRGFKGGLLYHRTTGAREVRKRIYSSRSELFILPVEPFYCPKMITSNLMIELTRNLVIPPRQVKKIYLKFPVEIGILAFRDNRMKIIDVFTENPPNYALYGDIKEGVVCRYYSSDVHVKPPKGDPKTEGVMEVNVSNSTRAWREVSKLVFEGSIMKVFYSDSRVTTKARASLIDDEKAETRFQDRTWIKGQKRSQKLLTPGSFQKLSTKFTMEGGY